jgi:hypothetical protein
MSTNLPVDFEALAKVGGTSSQGGYPYQLSSKDLMRNFVFASLQVDAEYLESTTGMNGYEARKLKMFSLPESPGSGTYVLGAVSGTLQWIATEEC